MFEDWLNKEHIDDFKRDFRGVAFEARCPCGTIIPLLFEEGSTEHEELIGEDMQLEVEVECHECGQTTSVKTGETAHCVWDSRKGNT